MINAFNRSQGHRLYRTPSDHLVVVSDSLPTCGMGTYVMVLIGGLKLRSRLHALAAVGYFRLTVVFFAGVQFTKPGYVDTVEALVMPPFLVIWLGGIAHTIVLQLKVRGQR